MSKETLSHEEDDAQFNRSLEVSHGQADDPAITPEVLNEDEVRSSEEGPTASSRKAQKVASALQAMAPLQKVVIHEEIRPGVWIDRIARG